MSWEIEMYYRLLSEGQLAPGELGPLPLPADIAHAMERCADGLERHASALADNVMPMAPDELRWLAAEIRDGTPAGRLAFRATLLDIVEIKRRNKPTGGVTRYLPMDVLAPFGAGDIHDDRRGEHARRYLDEIADTKELTDPSLRC